MHGIIPWGLSLVYLQLYLAIVIHLLADNAWRDPRYLNTVLFWPGKLLTALGGGENKGLASVSWVFEYCLDRAAIPGFAGFSRRIMRSKPIQYLVSAEFLED